MSRKPSAPKNPIGVLVEVMGLISGEVVLAQSWGDERTASEIANEMLTAFGMPDLSTVRERLLEAAFERAMDGTEAAPPRRLRPTLKVVHLRSGDGLA